MSKQIIHVTKSFLPPIKDYVAYLNRIWESNQLTNNGTLVRELEQKLKEYLDVPHLFFISNGTIALQIAIKALGLHDEVITTPFTYVATTSSLVWEGCQPVFVDIDPQTLCIDAELIEATITERTTGIVATHVYGIPCDVEKIEAVAQKYRLKVLYDAAHTFGGRYQGKSIVSYGDLSVLSFHATKLFHTGEGGAIITQDEKLAHRISYMRNFGHKGQEDFWGLGINGKNSEFHAAMGLCNLPYIAEIIASREEIFGWYDDFLTSTTLTRPKLPEGCQYNFAYYPVIFRSESELTLSRNQLNKNNIFPRRYFYPPLSDLPYIHDQHVPISEDISTRILCLPLFPGLTQDEVNKISQIIKSFIK